MKIYTKTGDKGQTDLIGKRVDKDDLRIECYGTLDEANSHIGVLISSILLEANVVPELIKIQRKIFDINTQLASIKPLQNVNNKDIEFLENRIDFFENKTGPMTSFILPGGAISSSRAHVVRTILRRAERRIISLQKEIEVDPLLLKYINRLSDYFFALARYMNHLNNIQDIKK